MLFNALDLSINPTVEDRGTGRVRLEDFYGIPACALACACPWVDEWMERGIEGGPIM